MTFNKVVGAAVGCVLAMWGAAALAGECPGVCYEKRWVYWGGNLMNDKLAEGETQTAYQKYLAMLPNAKAAGFKAIALNAGGSGSWTALIDPRWSEDYRTRLRTRLEDAIEAANAAGLEVIPVGGNPEMPAYLDPTLREAFPVSTYYKVKGGRATVENQDDAITNGGFENALTGNWGFDAYSSATLGGGELVSDEAHTGTRSLKLTAKLKTTDTDKYGMARLIQAVSLKANTAYRLSFWLKADTYAEPTKLRLLVQKSGGGVTQDIPIHDHGDSSKLGWGTTAGAWNEPGNAELLKTNLGKGWKQYNVQFNSGNQTSAHVYLGTWAPAKSASTVWVDDVSLREIGISHPVERNDGRDYIVQSKDGKITYPSTAYAIEGEQLVIKDPSIGDDTVLKVSWRQSAEHVFTATPPAIACKGGNYFDWQDKYYTEIDKLTSQQPGELTGGQQKYFMYYDEIRVLNWETRNPSCATASAGDYLGRMVRGVQNLRPTSVEYMVWNDMFDPNMNAIAQYWQVNGNLAKPAAKDYGLLDSTVIVNWTAGADLVTNPVDKRQRSLAYFKDYRQVVAMYYDDLRSTAPWVRAIKEAQAADPNLRIDGLMYTTWNSDYTRLNEFADQIRNSDLGQHWPSAQPAR